jgi:cell wall-associated NlpC family hydrolase
MKACLMFLMLAALPLCAEPVKKESTKPKASSGETVKPKTGGATGEKKETQKPKSASAEKEKPEPSMKAEEGKEKKDAPTEGKDAGKKSPHGQPALIATTDLVDFEALPADRKKLIEGAIKVAKESPWLPYKFGGSSPADGGFDCSGAMYFVMNRAELKPPRTSADQYLWLKENQRLHEAPDVPLTPGHPSLAGLRPGDLLFWSGTYAPTDGRTVNITHVAIYLGLEKKDKRPVMINATDGRSYRGRQANGYGVYDFYLPKEGGKSKFMGFGTPPGIAEIRTDTGGSAASEPPAE